MLGKTLLFTLLDILVVRVFSLFEIHIIPQSHLDPGWGWTTEEYYKNRVEKMFDSVFESMKKYSDVTFTICEIIYFKTWYNSKNEEDKKLFKQFILQKRIEIVGGGYVMNDEATTSYFDIVTQMRFGLQFVQMEFGVSPKTAWFLDSFGHSEANALIMTQLGYKFFVADRINYQEFNDRMDRGEMDFYFRPFNNSMNKRILYHITPYHYGNPICGFCISQEKLTPEEIEKIPSVATTFVNELMTSRRGYKNKDIFMHLLGGDFQYQESENSFDRIRALMDYVNTHTFQGEQVKMFFSTPERYFQAIEEENIRKNETLKEETDLDFFVYADKPYCYWSGYFTSRPFLKGVARDFSKEYFIQSYLHSELVLKGHKNIYTMESLTHLFSNIQHHDAITGTSNERVSDYFIQNSMNAIETFHFYFPRFVENYYMVSIAKLCYNSMSFQPSCEDILISNNSTETLIGLFNPLIEGEVLITIQFSSYSEEYKVYKNNKIIPSDFYCTNELPGFRYQSKCFLNFFFTFKKSKIIKTLTLKKEKSQPKKPVKITDDKIELLKDEELVDKIVFDRINYFFEVSLKNQKHSYTFELFRGYFTGQSTGTRGNSTFRPEEGNLDGMYIFAPLEDYPDIFSRSDVYLLRLELSSVLFIRDQKGFFAATFYKKPFFLKVDHFLNPTLFPTGENVVFVISSDLNNEIEVKTNSSKTNETVPEFFTDSNGLQMERRVRDYKYHYDYKVEDPVASNFYPVVSSISIREKKVKKYCMNKYDCLSLDDKMISVFPDRPESGGVLRKGEIIMLINRNSFNDDDKGIGANLFEEHSSNNLFHLTHMIMFGSSIYQEKNDNYKSVQFFYNYNFNSVALMRFRFKTETLKSLIGEAIICSENIRVYFEIFSDQLIIAYFQNFNDYFYSGTRKEGEILIDTTKLDKIIIAEDRTGSYFNVFRNVKEEDCVLKKYTLQENEGTFIYFKVKSS